jgi:signal peptidase II
MRAAASDHRVLRRLVLVALLVLALDQATKLLVRLVFAEELPVRVTGFFNLVLAYNRGVSFSLLTLDGPAGPYLLAGLALLIVGALVWWVRRNPRPFYALLAGLIVGGALGNMLDRLYLGAVVDFLDFHAFGWHWPAFNVADSAVVIGALCLIGDGLFQRRPESK